MTRWHVDRLAELAGMVAFLALMVGLWVSTP